MWGDETMDKFNLKREQMILSVQKNLIQNNYHNARPLQSALQISKA